MSDKLRDIIVVFLFLTVLILIFIANILKEDTEISITERRRMASFPIFNIENIFNGSFCKEFENYTTDQIVQRENFRKFKSIIELNIFRKKDNNDIYIYNDKLVKIEYPLNENSINNVANKINQIKSNYLKNMKCYYSIVPDKNYFSDNEEYIHIDYNKLQEIMEQNISDVQYINIFDCLNLNDYYITDIHWKQECLTKVSDKIASEMDFKNRIKTPYTEKIITEFDGVYSNQLPIKTEKDEIRILTNEIIDGATVYQYENGKTSKVYDMTKLNSKDKYDIYLSGATPLITITNSKEDQDKELIVFRDSFGSSLIPLFTEAYSKIILVDIRYMRSSDIKKYIELDDQDVLFLYSTTVLNNSGTFR